MLFLTNELAKKAEITVSTGINEAWAPGRCIMGREKAIYKGSVARDSHLGL